MPTVAEIPVPRPVRLSAECRRQINLGLAAAVLALIIVFGIGYLVLANARDYLVNGKPIAARIKSFRHVTGKSQSVNLDIDYSIGSRPYSTQINIPWRDGRDLREGDLVGIRVRDALPEEVWYGPLSDDLYRQRLNASIGGGIGIIVFFAAIVCMLTWQARHELSQLRDWIAVPAKLSEEKGFSVIRAKYTFGGRSHKVEFHNRGRFDHLQEHVLMNPKRPEEAALISAIQLAEIKLTLPI